MSDERLTPQVRRRPRRAWHRAGRRGPRRGLTVAQFLDRCVRLLHEAEADPDDRA